MNKFFPTLFLLLIELISFGQAGKRSTPNYSFLIYKGDTINKISSDSIKEGKWIEFKNGKPFNKGLYIHNTKEGEWIQYFDQSDSISSRISYVNDEANGVAMVYDTLGNLMEAGTWSNNRWVGTYELFYPEGGVHQYFTFNNDGLREGVSKYYYKNGIIQSIEMHKNGQEQMILSYDSIGKLVSNKLGDLDLSFNIKLYVKFLNDIVEKENAAVFQRENLLAAKAENQKQKIIGEEKVKQQAFIRNVFIFGFSIMLLIAFFSYRSFIRKKKDNSIITLQKSELEEQQKAIIDSITYARRIQRSLLPTEKYISRTIERLKNS